MVNISSLPILLSTSLLLFLLGNVIRFDNKLCYADLFLFVGLSFFIFFFSTWFVSVTDESRAYHTYVVQNNLIYGMLLFITSEVMFFFSFFWAFFYAAIAPVIQLGSVWPPLKIEVITFDSVPLLNTVVLLSSGVTATIAHKGGLSPVMFREVLIGFIDTIFYGIIFSELQNAEYNEAKFTISDSVYGSVFFMATGFHGFHVLIGTFFLFVNLIRYSFSDFTSSHHIGIIAASWYWHFVDVVWLFLYFIVYYWSTLVL